jgi:hypothetical protein
LAQVSANRATNPLKILSLSVLKMAAAYFHYLQSNLKIVDCANGNLFLVLTEMTECHPGAKVEHS